METNRFSDSFGNYVCDGDTIEAHIDGFDIVATIVADEFHGAPWDNEDGHGPVSEWRRLNSKRPGERVLIEDRGSARFYDVEEATRIAKRDGWDAPPFGHGTKGERVARAVERDYNVLRAWCNDEWRYVGVVLSVSRKGVTLDEHAASLWGIEANYPGSDNSYLTDVANELLDEALDIGREAMASLCGE